WQYLISPFLERECGKHHTKSARECNREIVHINLSYFLLCDLFPHANLDQHHLRYLFECEQPILGDSIGVWTFAPSRFSLQPQTRTPPWCVAPLSPLTSPHGSSGTPEFN